MATLSPGVAGLVRLPAIPRLPVLPDPLRRVRIPKDLESITSVGAEADPSAGGVERRNVEAIWKAALDWYRTGVHPALQVCVRRNGAVILDRAIGHARGNGPGDAGDAERVAELRGLGAALHELERRGELTQAQQWLASVDSPEQALAVQTRLAQILARQGRLEEARQSIRAAPERSPEDARLKLLAEAQLLRDHGQPGQAYELLNGALQQTPDEETLLYEAAMAAERVGRFEVMERLLRRLIELKPGASHAYNALGYALADRNLRLPEARTLIEKAVQLSPNDAYIQDSLGWVQFRQGNLRQARQTLEAAFRKRPDAEIAAHLGEVLWILGEREAALRVWREGQRLEADNETLRKTLLRLRVRL